MFPIIAKYKKWSLPSKFGLWGSLASLLSLIPIAFAVHDWIVAVPDYAALAFNYGTSEMMIYGAAGDSPETAVIIRGANSQDAGIKAEYYWIQRRYPGYERTTQAIFHRPEPRSFPPQAVVKDVATGVEVVMVQAADLPPRYFDVLTLRNWYGRTREVNFDVNTFLAKGSEPGPDGVKGVDPVQKTIEKLRDAINRKKEEQSRPAEKAK